MASAAQNTRLLAELVRSITAKDHAAFEQCLATGGGNIDLNAKYGQNGRTPLMYACEARDITRTLLHRGADVNAVDDMNSETALHLASAAGDVDVVTSLLEFQADINLQTLNGQTALLQAVGEKHEAVVRTLLGHNADVNVTNKRMNSPLHWAIVYQLEDIARMLMQHNPDLSIKNKDGKTPVDIARETGNSRMVCILENRELPDVGPNVSQLSSSYLTILGVTDSSSDETRSPGENSMYMDKKRPVPASANINDMYLTTDKVLREAVGAEAVPVGEIGEGRGSAAKDTIDGYGVFERDNPFPVEHECPSREFFFTLSAVKDTCSDSEETTLLKVPAEAAGVAPRPSGNDQQIVEDLQRDIHHLHQNLHNNTNVSLFLRQRIDSLEAKCNSLERDKSKDAEHQNMTKDLRAKYEMASEAGPIDRRQKMDRDNMQKATAAQIAELMERLAIMEKRLENVHSAKRGCSQDKSIVKDHSNAERLREQIHSRLTQFISDLEPMPHLDFLYQERVLSQEEYQNLAHKDEPPRKVVRQLMMKLLSKPADRWVFKFLKSLEEDNYMEDLVKELKNA